MKKALTFVFISGLLICGCSEDKKNDTLKAIYINSIGMELLLMPSGSFMMGADSNIENGNDNEKPRHNVTISKSFYIGRYEVTQEQWTKVMGNNPSKFKGDTRPVESVSWYDVKIFISKLNAMENTTRYRLPTEAEWEYAARASTTTKYSFGNDESKIDTYAWYYDGWNDKNSKRTYQTHPVGEKKPNRWGLYDVHGNVWEMVDDWYDAKYYAVSPPKDPMNYITSDTSVIRGGGWISSPEFLRSATRFFQKISYKGDDVGVRLAMSVADDK